MPDAAGPSPPVPTGFDPHVAEAFAAGAFAEARRLLRPSIAAAPSPFAQVIELDIGARRLVVGADELRVRRDELGPGLDDGLRSWLGAAIAERLLWDLDPQAATFAAAELDHLPPDPFPPLPVLYARARLHRVACLTELLAPTRSRPAAFRDHRDAALTDFVRCGYAAEVVATRVFSSALHVLLTGEDPFDNMDRLNAAHAQLAASGRSAWTSSVELVRFVTAFAVGDQATLADAAAAVTRGRAAPALRSVSRFVTRFAVLVGGGPGPDALADLRAALDDVARHAPHQREILGVQVAHALVDRGWLTPADAAWYGPADPGTVGAIERRLLRARAEIAAGATPEVDDLLAWLAELADRGRGRATAGLALRVADDIDRAGALGDRPPATVAAEATRLRRWAGDRLPPHAQRTVWEQLWAGPGADALTTVGAATGAPDAGIAAAANVTGAGPAIIRVLVPAVAVEVDGRPVPLREAPAKLLLALVLAHPATLDVTAAGELLWPDDRSADVRARLNTVVHRLRTALGPVGAAVRREDDRLALELGGCAVDLLQYRRALAADADRRGDALRSIAGNLADAQFPYDEPFVDARHAFVAEWRRQVGDLPAVDGRRGAEEAGAPSFADAAAALGLAPGDWP